MMAAFRHHMDHNDLNKKGAANAAPVLNVWI